MMSCCQNKPTRRTFLAAGGAVTAAVSVAACTSEPQRPEFSDGVFTRALTLDQLAPGDATQLAVGGSQILLYRESESTVWAYSAVCTHEGCIVGVGDDTSDPFICPCHASNFDKLTGEAVAGPAQLPLTKHETSIEDGWILVEVEPA